MKAGRAVALLLLGSVAACTTMTGRHQPAHKLVGTWVYEDHQTRPQRVEDCETDFAVSYAGDGTFSGYEEAGTWRIEDGHLVETITETWEMGSGPETHRVENPSPSRIRLEWISPDVVNLLGINQADGYGLVRCRPYRGS